MNVFTTKPYLFTTPDGGEHTMTPNRVQPIPEWVPKTELFQLAVEAGNIRVMPDKTKPTPLSDPDTELQQLRERAKSLGISNAYKMGKDRLLKEIAAHEVVEDGDEQQDI